MRLWARDALQAISPLGIARLELPQEMPPFVLELPASHHDETGRARATDFPGREAVTAKQRFRMNSAQVFGDRTDWRA
jgi:hypothetical protein